MCVYNALFTMKHSPSQEAALVSDLKLGLEEAVEVWYRQYFQLVLTFISRKIDNKKDAEEITRETFLNCLRQLPLFQQKSTLKTWMFRIASHEVADYYRRRYAKKFIHSLPLSNLLFIENPRDMHETSQAVVDTLKKLRTDYKQLLLLKYVEHVPVKEIARQLGRSIKSVESDLFRARQEFRLEYAARTTS